MKMMQRSEWARALGMAVMAAGMMAAPGCGGKTPQQKEFFTSGSREADQRAEQKMAQTRQIRGEPANEKKLLGTPAKKSLYERIGGEQGLSAIVDDFVSRVLADPRVNWERKGSTRGGFMGVGKKSATWDASEDHVKVLKTHLVQFLSVATGGPTTYEGRDMREVHHGMKVDNSEFDAAVGDLKATMDKLGVGTAEQKELISVVESARAEVVEKR